MSFFETLPWKHNMRTLLLSYKGNLTVLRSNNVTKRRVYHYHSGMIMKTQLQLLIFLH
jgi:hypothetical protein